MKEFVKPDEFLEMDKDSGVMVYKEPSCLSSDNDIVNYRNKLISEYHDGSPTLFSKMEKMGKDDLESLINALILEMVQESDNLLGNGLIATENGELRDASVISSKRADILEKAIKAFQTKKQFETQGGIDVDSPSMMIVFRFFLSKVKEAFDKMGLQDEVPDLFFRTFGNITNNWKKDLQSQFTILHKR